MRRNEVYRASTLAVAVLFVACVACEPESAPEPTIVDPVPEGYEKVPTGSGCREKATGQYVDPSKCGLTD